MYVIIPYLNCMKHKIIPAGLLSVNIKEAATPLIKTDIKQYFNICTQHAWLISHNLSILFIYYPTDSTSGPLMRLTVLPVPLWVFSVYSGFHPMSSSCFYRNDVSVL